VDIIDDLPKTPSGKILRRLLVPAAAAEPEPVAVAVRG
jgi:acyl-coenzyme A synthetase/AMP-(fatty) acid ligase